MYREWLDFGRLKMTLTTRRNLLVLGSFFGAVLLINPLREGAVFDDWAYAWTVKNWIETGNYQLHDWLSANMPFQAVVGAAFCSLMGYSFAALHLSTLFLSLCGLCFFYLLAREHELDPRAAALLTLGLMASPLALLFSCIYMTDGPFLACVIASLYLYTRAIRLRSPGWMFAASLAASAAILTRQFGVGLLGGLSISWISSRESRRRPFLYLLGVLAPCLAAGWQIYAGMKTPNWAAILSRSAQGEYWSHPLNAVTQYFIRLSIAFHYFALFAAPFVLVAPVIFISAHVGNKSLKLKRVPSSSLDKKQALFLVFMTLWGLWALSRIGSWFMPYLPWAFPILAGRGTGFGVLLLLFTAAGGLLIARACFLRYRNDWQRLSPAQRFLDYATLLLLLLQLSFCKFGDEYLLQFLPYVLIVVGVCFRPWFDAFPRLIAYACLVVLLVSALWTRSILDVAEAKWTAAESLHKSGVPPSQIQASWEWISFYRFKDYIADLHERPILDPKDFFERWIPQQEKHASYFVGSLPKGESAAKFIKIREIPFRDLILRLKHYPVWRRKE
jgi:4-amino-4-deoxy-L-arabinose transferase-like glycosyltransferase